MFRSIVSARRREEGGGRIFAAPGALVVIVVGLLMAAQLFGAAQVFAQMEVRALSLRVLQDRLRKKQMTPEVTTLGYITRIDGYMVDKANKDIILYGPSRQGPPLNVDDMVVALRAGSQPGCSIDPNPVTINHINRLSNKASSSGSIERAEGVMRQICEVGRAPQNVRIIDIPRGTHFAKVLVDADYQAKRVANGTDCPHIAGFRSICDAMIAQARADLAHGVSPAMPMLMNRLWFTPGKVRLSRGAGLTHIDDCAVKLLTEQQYLGQGKLVGSGAAGPFAGRFVQQFTQKYDQIARSQPIYRELQSEFRYVALARGLEYENAFAKAGMNADYLLRSYKTRPVSVPMTLPGITDLRVVNLDQGSMIARLLLMSVGGVTMDMTVDAHNFVARQRGVEYPGIGYVDAALIKRRREEARIRQHRKDFADLLDFSLTNESRTELPPDIRKRECLPGEIAGMRFPS